MSCSERPIAYQSRFEIWLPIIRWRLDDAKRGQIL